MTQITDIQFIRTDIASAVAHAGRLAVLMEPGGAVPQALRRLNTLTRGALKRLGESKLFEKLEPGESHQLLFPAGLAAEALLVVRLGPRPDRESARKAGAAMAAFQGDSDLLVLAGGNARAADIAFGLALRGYAFSDHKTGEKTTPGAVRVMTTRVEAAEAAFRPMRAVAEGVFFTRDLVNAPANVLTTVEFARRLLEMSALGLEVSVLDEPELTRLGMNALLGVGQGSSSPSKVVVMEWRGGDRGAAPFALIGKGVVFDTGGISLKPALGMEEMTMDMGGAGVVAGVMRALALRKARANVVGVVGLVENMPDGQAQRPGDVVVSMKGDTIEVVNTDAEGRLVLADILWYAQQQFKPSGMVNLATLTGAMIIALGHENAGVFANDDRLAEAFLKAARDEGEGAWRMPMGKGYDKLIKSRIADVKNVGGRPAGAITAAQFLGRFVGEEVPWIHLDIAGVALLSEASDLAPKGATGWGVRALDALIRQNYEKS